MGSHVMLLFYILGYLTSSAVTRLHSFTSFIFDFEEDVTDYDTVELPSSLKIVLMRHGQSEQNLLREHLMEKFHSRHKAVAYQLRETDSTNLVDAMLTPKGVEQAKESGVNLAQQYPNIKYVFLSPMRRTVETAVNAMEEYSPNSDPEYILNPWMRESIQTLADVPLLSYEYLDNFPFIDRSELSSNPRFWFLDYFLDSRTTKTEHLLKEAVSGPDYLQKLGDLLSEHTEGLEHPSQIEERIQEGMNLIRDFVHEKFVQGEVVKDHEILIVGHGFVLSHLLGYKVIHPNDTYGGLIGGDFLNGELKSYELTKI